MNMVTKLATRANLQDVAQPDAYDARDLIRDGVQAHIVLDGQIYTLRITRAGKLILTK
jgi:hemin uptake protein HemP